MIKYIIQMVTYTLAIIGVLLLSYIAYKKFMLNDTIRKNSHIKIKDMLRLPDRKILYLVECDGETLLIGSSMNNITKIAKISEPKVEYMEDIIEESYINEDIKHNENLFKKLSDNNKNKRGNY